MQICNHETNIKVKYRHTKLKTVEKIKKIQK